MLGNVVVSGLGQHEAQNFCNLVMERARASDIAGIFQKARRRNPQYTPALCSPSVIHIRRVIVPCFEMLRVGKTNVGRWCLPRVTFGCHLECSGLNSQEPDFSELCLCFAGTSHLSILSTSSSSSPRGG